MPDIADRVLYTTPDGTKTLPATILSVEEDATCTLSVHKTRALDIANDAPGLVEQDRTCAVIEGVSEDNSAPYTGNSFRPLPSAEPSPT